MKDRDNLEDADAIEVAKMMVMRRKLNRMIRWCTMARSILEMSVSWNQRPSDDGKDLSEQQVEECCPMPMQVVQRGCYCCASTTDSK